MITMCNKDNRSTLMLTPSHGKHGLALAVIAAVHGHTLYAENVEPLQQARKEKLTKTIRQEMALVTLLLQHKKYATWDETTSPIASSRCRALSKSPTGPEIDAMPYNDAKKTRLA